MNKRTAHTFLLNSGREIHIDFVDYEEREELAYIMLGIPGGNSFMRAIKSMSKEEVRDIVIASKIKQKRAEIIELEKQLND